MQVNTSFASFTAIQQEQVLLSKRFDWSCQTVAKDFPILLMTLEEQWNAGLKFAWDDYGNCFPWEEMSGSIPGCNWYIPTYKGTYRGTQVRCGYFQPQAKPKDEKKTLWKKVVKLLNTKLF